MNEMKRGFKCKTIVENIENKIEDWVKTLPEEIRDDVKRDCFVSGGAIASMLQGNLPNDYDIYFKTLQTAQKVVNYYVSKLNPTNLVEYIDTEIVGDRLRIKIKSAGVASGDDNLGEYRYFESLSPEEMQKYFKTWKTKKENKYDVLLITSNAISLSDDVQIITRFVGLPEEVHKNFDFVHCTNWYDFENKVQLNQPALESILSKELKYVGSRYPVCSVFRIKKFIERGWTITAGEMFKICYDISQLDLDDFETLQDQLVGVDAAYFTQCLHLLKEKNEIDRTYLFEIINRVFDTNEYC